MVVVSPTELMWLQVAHGEINVNDELGGWRKKCLWPVLRFYRNLTHCTAEM